MHRAPSNTGTCLNAQMMDGGEQVRRMAGWLAGCRSILVSVCLRGQGEANRHCVRVLVPSLSFSFQLFVPPPLSPFPVPPVPRCLIPFRTPITKCFRSFPGRSSAAADAAVSDGGGGGDDELRVRSERSGSCSPRWLEGSVASHWAPLPLLARRHSYLLLLSLLPAAAATPSPTDRQSVNTLTCHCQIRTTQFRKEGRERRGEGGLLRTKWSLLRPSVGDKRR